MKEPLTRVEVATYISQFDQWIDPKIDALGEAMLDDPEFTLLLEEIVDRSPDTDVGLLLRLVASIIRRRSMELYLDRMP